MIAAIVLAAGLSIRMGKPKLTLPWGDTTVIGQVVSVIQWAGLSQIVVVTGGFRQQVEAALQELSVDCAFNSRYQQNNMALSLQVGISNVPSQTQAVLVALGDQPQIQVEIVRALLVAYAESKAPLLVPSYNMRRGHPWILDRSLWDDVMAITHPHTLRDLVNQHQEKIKYVVFENSSVLSDLDTPSDYERERPR